VAERILERLTDASGAYFDGVLVERRQTRFQLLEIYDTPELGRLFRLDGCNMTSERDEFLYHENLVHPAAIAHADPRQVLVVGGGDGGSSEEFLKHNTVERTHMVELDGEVIEVAKAHFTAVHRGVFDNPRLAVTVGDGLAHLASTRERYDLVAMDLTDPIGPSLELYSPATFALAKAALAEGGALTLHLGSPFFHRDRLQSTLRHLREVFSIVAPYFAYVPLYGSLWGFAVASDSLDPRRLAAAEIDRRIAERGLTDLQYYNGETHGAAFALPNYVRPLVS
jgi:spermidine synthase